MSDQTTTAAPTTTTLRAAVTERGKRLDAAKWALPLILLALVIIAGLTTPGFATFDNLSAILASASVVGIVAVGMTPITLSGNFFSLAASNSVVLAAVLFMTVFGTTRQLWLAVVATFAVLIGVGVAQGLVVAAGLNPVITTLAVGTILYGLVTIFTGGTLTTSQGADMGWIALTRWFGLPLPVYIFIAYTLLTWFIVERTVVGRRILLLGANRESAKISGTSARTTTVWAFLSLSIGVTIAGIVAAAQLQQVRATDLSSLTMDSVAAVLVGGTLISGGEGSPLRSAIGAVLIVALGNIMLLHGLPTGFRLLGVGILVVVVVVVLHLLRKASLK
jgi:ribose transport system permease protein